MYTSSQYNILIFWLFNIIWSVIISTVASPVDGHIQLTWAVLQTPVSRLYRQRGWASRARAASELPHAVYVGVSLGLRRGPRLAETLSLSLSLYNGWVKVGNPAGHIVSCCFGKSLFKSPARSLFITVVSLFCRFFITQDRWGGSSGQVWSVRIYEFIDKIGVIHFLSKLRIKS